MSKSLIVYIIAFGIFGIINAELGVVGILPQVSERYGVTASQAGMLVSLFALVIALFGPFMTLLFSGVNHKKMMAWVLAIFVVSNVISAFASNYPVLLISRIIPAFLHPVYFSAAFIAAANSVGKDQSTKAIAKVFMGVTAGMVFGIPITSYISNVISLEASLLFCGVINLIAFLGIVSFLPSMPVHGKMSYAKQLEILKKPQILLTIVAVGLIPSGMFAVYSYFAEYLDKVTHMSGKEISGMLILFGAAGIVGNIIAGKVFSRNLVRAAVLFPLVSGAVYLLLYFMGAYAIPMILIIIAWGILFTMGLNFSQNWLTSVASDAPEFANGLFVSFTNLGITLGTYFGGLFLSHMGPHQVVWSGVIFLALGFLSIILRVVLFDKAVKVRASIEASKQAS
ncbi:Predicted arabinose efflux permease, MFS family [Paenibacillus sp. yr247]|uniref:MFS transporter n=1 Tax=Paenibacillus sp. yr247 TaxID=1761880 RepID=UPI00088687C6|nr:MFS transporter [Paenibacillus sp. yr247]SDO84252.1 Predicted arabinose efflux permease, MFS family [Paenibacillus sp. yr247]